ncbi:hypothetical protein PVAP13_8NG264900 [Panicum virgatum]|uniref:FAE domain-containing protein n=1 Tax=Panicum virgatum TaxID=38727 RepID=A0A8T0P8J2_PANVG|nr:hypothetical protein PVAP13_8NG264900 [Panicum virgatum]
MAVVAAAAMLHPRAWTPVVSYGGELASSLTSSPVRVLMAAVILCAGAVAVLRRARRLRDVYLVDYGCFLGEPQHRVPTATATEHARLMPYLVDGESLDFMLRLHERSGIGEETSIPDSLRYMPPDRGVAASCAEAELVIFAAVDSALARAAPALPRGAADIDALVVACSFTTLAPEFADLVVNRYGLRADVRTVNLSGMGCSGALICVGLAKNLLQVAPPGTRALVVTTELLSSMFYPGTKREMLVPNVLFRMGAAAIVMSNSPERARFRIGHVVRTLTAARDRDYRCAFQEEDDQGVTGINLSKELPAAAARALQENLLAFAPAVLPASELLRVAFSSLRRKFLGEAAKRYRPAFGRAFQHIVTKFLGRSGRGTGSRVEGRHFIKLWYEWGIHLWNDKLLCGTRS